MKLSSLAFGVGSFKTNQFGVGDFGASGGGNSAPWYGSYLFRKKLTIDFTDVSSTLTNMPVPVFLDDSNFDFTKILTAGEDVRFVDSDQVTLLKYEKESIVRTVTDIYGMFLRAEQEREALIMGAHQSPIHTTQMTERSGRRSLALECLNGQSTI